MLPCRDPRSQQPRHRLARMKPFLAAILAACVFPLTANSQPYPNKPVHVIIPFPPGSSLDLVVRQVASKVEPVWGQKQVIEYRGGGNGMVGAESVARSAPDGYTLMFTSPSSQLSPPFLNKVVPYDPMKDFTPIAAVVEAVTSLAVHPSVPANTVKELIDYAKANPGKLSFGSSGTGSFFHLLGESFKTAAGVNIVHVPYKNIATAVSDVGGGHIPMVFTAVANTRPFVAAGKMKVLALLMPIGYAGRYGPMSQYPTITETMPDFKKPPSWFAYFGPAGMASTLVNRLNADIMKSLDHPDTRKVFEDAGMVLLSGSAQEFAAAYREGFEIYGRISKAAGIEPE
jgi:tripartite-type tricarboxylate transporter receptor subunit TctC